MIRRVAAAVRVRDSLYGRFHLTGLLLLWLACLSAASGAEDGATRLRHVVEAACDASSPSMARTADAIPGAALIEEDTLTMQGTVVGWKQHLRLPEGAEITIERFAPGGRLRRLAAEYREAAPGGGTRPRLGVVADTGCSIRSGRRLLYETDSPEPTSIEHLDASLEPTGEHEPLNPPVPEGEDPGGVPVAVVDAGVNYLLPEINRRLARDGDGAILGRDYWDLDGRPFDSNPARSPFFPQRHGTRTATLLLREAPAARLVPYRYPRPDMRRMTDLVSDAAAKGVVIVNMSMGSNTRDEWETFAKAARAHPQMLFVVSAGNNGRNIDDEPVFPAALPLENVITATSAERNGKLAHGSNWGSRSVDLLVPAEQVIVTDFDGNRVRASGSSYAAIRVTALAARLLATHPEWRAPELKAAVFSRALPPGDGTRVGRGFIPAPHNADRYPPLSTSGELEETARQVIGAGELYPDHGSVPRDGHLLKPIFAYFRNGAWTLDHLGRHARQTAGILARCDVFIPEIDVRVLDGPDRFRYFNDANAGEIVNRLDLPKPTVYFVRDTLKLDAYDAEAIGKSNSTTRPALRYTIWMTEATSDPGIALAHELSHILMDSGRHSDLPGNLMRDETLPANTNLTPEQCGAIVRTGLDNGLLTTSTRP